MTVLEQIQYWQQDPSVLEDEGLTAPTQMSLSIAEVLVKIINPDRVVPSGAGGVSFSWTAYLYTLEVAAGGDLDLFVWNGAAIDKRLRWTLREGDGE